MIWENHSGRVMDKELTSQTWIKVSKIGDFIIDFDITDIGSKRDEYIERYGKLPKEITINLPHDCLVMGMKIRWGTDG